ncbi:Ig-like domain-containing protein, partial [Pseudomonas sp. RW3S2]|uniref:Ig-like domain-containing protein n=1 Tax=Pseudomonas sp. RW3S2 TaxID=485884 RepID=UPI00192D64AD
DINDPQPNGKIIITATDAANNKSLPAILDFIADPKIDTTPPDAPTGLNVITKPTGGIGITGKAEPNSTVNVTTPDGKTHNVKAGPDGNFKLDINDPQPNGKIIITATDAANNKSLPAILEFIADPKIDTTPPDAPTGLNVISKPNEGIAITGKAEPNSTVNITSPDGKTHNVKAGPDGNFKLDINDPQPNGNISAVAIDAAGNKSVPANLTYNLARPSAPTYDIATDQATGEFTLTGKSAPGLKVRIELPNKVTKTVVVDADGNFTLSGPAPQGTSEFKAVAIDGQGRESAATVKSYENPFTKYEVKVESYTDTVGSDGQIIANNKFERHPLNVPTNDPAPTLHGRATGVGSGNSIEIISKGDGKRVALGAVDSDGNWSIKLPAHSDGVYNYDVRIIDGARNVKGAQVTVNLTIDTVPPPAPTLDSIVTKDGVDVKSGKATVDNTPTLRGHAEANATVIIFHKNADGKNVELMRVVADANGEWTAALPFQSNRQHSYYVNALDAASNLSEASSVSQVTFNGPTNKPIAITGSQGVWSVDSAGNVDGSGFDSVAGLGYDSGNYNALLRGNANVSESQHPKYQLGNIDTGFHTAGLGDTNGDGLNDIASVHSGTNSRSRADVRVYNGAQNLGVTSEKYMKMFENPKVIGTGYFVSGAGDLDGDGLMDTVLGGYGAFGQNGTSTVVFGGKQVDPKNTVTDFKFGASDTNVNSYDAFYSGAQYVSATGDFLGGGSRGIVTARGITIGNPDRGSISKTTDFEWVTGTGAREVNQVQSVAGVGDTNGDGFSDVLVNDGTNLFVVYGGTLAEFSKFRNKIVLEEKWLKENNRGYMIDASSALAAQPTKYGDVRALGDINGDGLMDFAYSTYGNSGAGAAKQGGSYGSYQNSYIIFGKADNEKIDMAKFTPKQGIVVPKEQADGASIAGRLDINGDGLPDIYVGSYQSSGKLYLGGTSLGAEPSISVDNTTGLAMGNADSNFIKGTAGNDTIYGKGGADVIYAGSGDDVIILNKDNLSFLLKGFQESAGLHGRLARIDGGNGIDTLAFEKDVNDFDLAKITTTGLGTIKTGVGLSRLANMEVLDLNGGNKMKLTIDLKHVMDMTSGMNMFNKSNFSSGLDEAVSRNQVVIKGSSDNVVEVKDKGEWKTESTKTIYSEGHAYNVYNSVGDHQGQLLIEQTINVNWV